MRLLRLVDRYCDRTLLLLLRTFLDIIALRKGPEQIPHSWLLLTLAIASMLVASLCALVLIDPAGEQSLSLSLLTNAVGIGFYAAVLVITGYSRRMLQTLTTVLGCGAILTMLFVAEFVFLRPFLGAGFAGVIATLTIFWSVPVEGHIIARAIDRHWFFGIAIAIAAFVLQFAFQSYAAQSLGTG
ncbi:MAG TPA: hypothetical protein VFG91_05740 [Woeseiaceae bacterium]|nr:hypothetical protein [Woeseiaceae bacterium]